MKTISKLQHQLKTLNRVQLQSIIVVLAMATLGVTALHFSSANKLPTNPQTTQRRATFQRHSKLTTLPLARNNISPQLAQKVSEEILVTYKPNADIQKLSSAFGALNAQETDSVPTTRLKVIKVPAAQRATVIQALKANPLVQSAEPNAVVQKSIVHPDDEYYDYGDEWWARRINNDLMWDKTHGSTSTVIAVVDTGLDKANPDFSGKTVTGRNVVDNSSNTDDGDIHGTLVSALAAANVNNGVGIAGACWDCKIMPVKVISGGGETDIPTMIKGINYAADNHANVINLSLGTDTPMACDSATQNAVNHALDNDAIVVAGAGNTGKSERHSPADCTGVVSVAATDQSDFLTGYSTYNSDTSLGAPGDIVGPVAHQTDTFAHAGGTSFSSPIVAGILASLQAAFPSVSNSKIIDAAIKSADPCCSGKIKGGRINAMRAYAYLASDGNLTDTTKPVLVEPVYPRKNSTVGGDAIDLGVQNATDNVAIGKEDTYYLAGRTDNHNLFGFTTGTSPYVVPWDTSQEPDGTKVYFKAVATDTTGNPSDSIDWSATFNQSSPPPPVAPPNPPPPTPPPTTPPPTTPPPTPPPTTPPPTTPPPTTPPPTTPPPTTPPKTGDVNGDGKVNITDLSQLLAAWGSSNASADFNKSGKVDITDLSQLLANWGK